MRIHNLPEMHERLELTDTFQFSCSKGLRCFGSCCRNRDLTLTPYDVLRLKNNLRLHSDDFLTRHTQYRLDPSTGFPLISIKLGPAPEKLMLFTQWPRIGGLGANGGEAQYHGIGSVPVIGIGVHRLHIYR